MHRFKRKRVLPMAVNQSNDVSTSSSSDLYSPLDWTNFFSNQSFVDVNSARFCVYEAGTELTRASVLFLLVHGAGQCALTFSLMARHLATLVPQCAIRVVDLRCHGATQQESESDAINEADLTLQQLVGDVACVVAALNVPTTAKLILVGHSLGGSIVTALAQDDSPLCPKSKPAGLVVMDVVEGTAMEAMQFMPDILAARPTRFMSPRDAVAWAFKERVVRNSESARVSVPGQLQTLDDGSVTWRTDLAATAKLWPGWFEGLSARFLHSTCPRLLMLADHDRLDVPLTAAHMAGKFRLELVKSAGHALQEDAPEHVARTIASFVQRQCLISADRMAVLNQANQSLAEKKKENEMKCK